MALTVLNNPRNLPAGGWYTGKCSTCLTVVTGQLSDFTFYQAAPSAQLAPAATVPPVLIVGDATGHIRDWLYVKCPTGGCPATIWVPTTSYTSSKPGADPVSNSPAPVQPLT